MATTGYGNFDGVWLATSAAPARTVWGVGTAKIVATGGAVKLASSGLGETMVGASGDDTFVVGSTKDSVVRGAGGVDTVIAAVNYVLPAGIQNLTLLGTWGPVVGVGNTSANIVKADRAGETVIGGAGDDVLVGAGGGDTFIFQPGSGRDVIVGFHTASAGHDVARLPGYGFTSFAAVRGAMTQHGADVWLRLSATDLIDFRNTTVSSFTAADFQIGVDTAGKAMSFDDGFSSLSLYNAATRTGTWKASYAWGSQTGLDSHTILNAGEREVDVDPSFAGEARGPLDLNPFSISSGILSISASATPSWAKSSLWNYSYVSGVLTTQKSFSQTYGYFEMRAEMPATPKGLWPAFWLVPADGSYSSELDVFEMVGDAANTIHNSVHYYPKGSAIRADTSFSTYVPNLLGGFHTYGVLWTASTITWYVDGAAVASTATPAGMNKPMYMITNLSVGGVWPGAPDATTKFPANLKIDYIHAYTLAQINAHTTTASAPPPVHQTLVGGAGNDVFHVTSTADQVIEQASHGNDLVISTVSYAVPNNVESLDLVGTGLTARGKAAGYDWITSLQGGNTLVGGAAGHDVFIVGQSNVVIEVAKGAPDETVRAWASYALPANIQTLIGEGHAALHLTGDALANVIIANTGADTLTGGAGSDTFVISRGDRSETITDFKVSDHDQIDIAAFLAKGLHPSFADHGTYSTATFTTGETITVLGVHASSLRVSGHDIV